jgi:osmotically-inducible protein OsmY
MVINLEGMSIRSACATVVEAARSPEFEITAGVREHLTGFVMACKVKVALATHPASRGLDLDVVASGNVVTISGEVPQPIMLTHTSSRWEQELTQIAKSIAGVHRVELKIQSFNAYR